MTIISAEETLGAVRDALLLGDDVLIHASLKSLGTFVPGVETIIDAF